MVELKTQCYHLYPCAHSECMRSLLCLYNVTVVSLSESVFWVNSLVLGRAKTLRYLIDLKTKARIDCASLVRGLRWVNFDSVAVESEFSFDNIRGMVFECRVVD